MKSFSDKYHTIHIHVGAHRTGTSSLQAHLHAARAELLEQGIDVIAPGVAGMRNVVNGRPFMKEALKLAMKADDAGLGSFLYRQALQKLMKQNLATRPDGLTLVLSEENLLGKALSKAKPGVLYPQAGKRMKALASLIGAPDELAIHLAIRPYDTFILSYLMMQQVYGNSPLGLQEIRPWLKQGLTGWPSVVSKITRNFPKAKIHVWAPGKFGLDARFQELTGIAPPHRDTELSQLNASPTMEALEEIALRKKSEPDLGKEARDAIVKKHSNGTSAILADHAEAEQVDELAQQYTRDLLMLRENGNITVET